jgi:hypothetical protein
MIKVKRRPYTTWIEGVYNRVVRRIYGYKREAVIGSWRK